MKGVFKKCHDEYDKLTHTQKKNEKLVCSIVDPIEEEVVKLLNKALQTTGDCVKYTFIWANNASGYSHYKDLIDGDIYLVINNSGIREIIRLDLKTSTVALFSHSCHTGVYLGGEINKSSFDAFPGKNHFYMLLSYLGEIITLYDSLVIHEYLKNLKPNESKFNPNNPYYTVKDHLKKCCVLNKDVFVVRNITEQEITCFRSL